MLLNGCAPGSALNQRVGRHINMIRAEFSTRTGVTATTGIDQDARFLVVLDKQPNGDAPAVTDILDAVTALSQPNLAYSERFKILADRVFELNASAEPGSRRYVRMTVPLNKVVTYNSGTAGTIADISTNSLYFVQIGSVAAGATAGNVYGQCRLRFSDV